MSAKRTLALLIGLSFAAYSYAAEHRQHDAHTHGTVALHLAQDGQDLLLEVTAPGADVVGFEHAPENAKQRSLLKQATKTLQNPDDLFIINPQAQCRLTQQHVSHTLIEHQEHHHSHSDADHHAHQHDEHGAFTAHYHYHCQHMEQLKDINTKWFDAFPSTEKIHATLLTHHTQSVINLQRNTPILTLKQQAK